MMIYLSIGNIVRQMWTLSTNYRLSSVELYKNIFEPLYSLDAFCKSQNLVEFFKVNSCKSMTNHQL